jgi:predicted nucleic acid-binding protein
MTITYIDAGMLIAAARGENEIARRAVEILDDPEREFASSIFVKLEVLPKPIYYGQQPEAEFYQAFFDSVSHWASSLETIGEDAYQEACASGLAAMDALHVAAARAAGATELVTTERSEKPLHRVKGIQIVSIYSSDESE